MKIAGKVAVITGAGNGVGRELAARFVRDGAQVVAVDVEPDSVQETAELTGALPYAGDLTQEQHVRAAAELAQRSYGRVDIWISNAGVSGPPRPAELPDDQVWTSLWQLHVMAHVYAARAVLPGMLERGEGYLFQTVSSAGLGIQPDKVVYTVTKHASIALGEWLATHYRHRGIRVTCFCPRGMRTRMLLGNGFPADDPKMLAALSLPEVAELIVRGIDDEAFLLATDQADVESLRARADDWDGYLDGLPHTLLPPQFLDAAGHFAGGTL
jgi:NAD(P)-dependent dehydrogenase (short-subunit alcohol dehydrogenase family)